MGYDYIDYETLKQEMLKRGATKTQVESKVLAIALDVITNSDGLYTDIVTQKQTLDALINDITAARTAYKALNAQKEREHEARVREAEEYMAYIEEFNTKLRECETPEARDRMRTAQMFINTVEVNTKYDNTAFIIGLASIISGEAGVAIDRLKKVNPKLFDEDDPVIKL